MSRIVSRFPLPPMSLGTERHLTVHAYGDPDARPKAYLQAGLHADELPGSLVLHHLIRRLDSGEDGMPGQIVIVPSANPVGQAQIHRGQLSGRFSMVDGTNFNRDYLNLTTRVGNQVDGRLGTDEATNVALIRDAFADILGALASETEGEPAYLRTMLMRLACDADIVLDLHCDDEALMHVYLAHHLWPQAEDLPAFLESPVTLLANRSGGDPFDESLSAPWAELRERFGDATPIPSACLASTVELRGATDVGDALAEEDADRLYRFLQNRGVIAGGATVPALSRPATPLTAMEIVKAPLPGIVSYRVPLGTEVSAGQPIADLIDPTADDPAEGRIEITAGTDGLLFARRSNRFVWPGESIAKIAGTRALPSRSGALLTP
ncbi:MAG: succinylglutamate desuccinylase/aspartoacylase family protein [Alphaproteobacteria bacterium]|nr:succinylglutamate desuccinylase/aspartoacylase family protein [Alphaproteobacteria bacterium]